jgi:hypothetical protein
VRSRAWFIVPALYGFVAAPSAGETDLYRNGQPSDHPVQWYSDIGMAIKQSLRDSSGECFHPVGEIVICKRRDNYRIDRKFLGSGRDFDPSWTSDREGRHSRSFGDT